jgi:hypothetical protein
MMSRASDKKVLHDFRLASMSSAIAANASISVAQPNVFMLVTPQGFRYKRGEPRKFSRSDLESMTREFCGEFRNHLLNDDGRITHYPGGRRA